MEGSFGNFAANRSPEGVASLGTQEASAQVSGDRVPLSIPIGN